MTIRVFSILHATANLDDNLTACIADTGLLVIPLGQARVHLTCICTCMYVLYHLDGKTRTHTRDPQQTWPSAAIQQYVLDDSEGSTSRYPLTLRSSVL